MTYVKNHCTKFVLLLLCLSQIQGEYSEESVNPYKLLNLVIRGSASRILELVHNRLIEAGVPADKLENIYHIYSRISIKINEVIVNIYLLSFPQYYQGLIENLEFEDQEIDNKVKKLNNELAELNVEMTNIFYDRVDKIANKTKPIAKSLIWIVDDIEEIIFAIFPEKTKEIKKN